MGIFLQDKLALAVNKRDNTLCIACQDKGHNGITYGVWDGKRWNTGYMGQTAGRTPALIYDNDTLCCYYIDGVGYGLYCVTSTNGYTWGSSTFIKGVTMSSGPAASVDRTGYHHLFYSNAGTVAPGIQNNGLLHEFSTDKGKTWK